jgi:hypothetical protein
MKEFSCLEIDADVRNRTMSRLVLSIGEEGLETVYVILESPETESL